MQNKEIFMPFSNLLSHLEEIAKNLEIKDGKNSLHKALYDSFFDIANHFKKEMPSRIKSLLAFKNAHEEWASTTKSVVFSKQSLLDFVQTSMLTFDSFLDSIDEKREKSTNEVLPIFKSKVLSPILENNESAKAILNA